MPRLRLSCTLLLAVLLLASCNMLASKGKSAGSTLPGSAQNAGSASGGSNLPGSSQAPANPPGDPVPGCPLAGFTLPSGTSFTQVSDTVDNWSIQLNPDTEYDELLKHVDSTLGQMGWHSSGVQDFGNGKLSIYTNSGSPYSVGVQYSAEPDATPFCIVNISKTPEQ